MLTFVLQPSIAEIVSLYSTISPFTIQRNVIELLTLVWFTTEYIVFFNDMFLFLIKHFQKCIINHKNSRICFINNQTFSQIFVNDISQNVLLECKAVL
jgi:hypothetical protein